MAKFAVHHWLKDSIKCAVRPRALCVTIASSHPLWLARVSSRRRQAQRCASRFATSLVCVYTSLMDIVLATIARHWPARRRHSQRDCFLSNCEELLLVRGREKKKERKAFPQAEEKRARREHRWPRLRECRSADVPRKSRASYELMWWMFVLSVRKTTKYLQRGIKRLVSVPLNSFMWFPFEMPACRRIMDFRAAIWFYGINNSHMQGFGLLAQAVKQVQSTAQRHKCLPSNSQRLMKHSYCPYLILFVCVLQVCDRMCLQPGHDLLLAPPKVNPWHILGTS